MNRLSPLPDALPEPRLKALRALYCSFNCGLGLSLPYLAPFLASRGIPGAVQGRLFALSTATAIASQPLMGLLADRFGIGRTLRLATILAAIGMASLLSVSGIWMVALVFVVIALGNGNVPVLLDAGTIAQLEGSPGGAHQFGESRIFGSGAFAVSALVFGLFFHGAAAETTGPAAVRLIAGFCCLSAVVSFALPPDPHRPHAQRPGLADVAALLRVKGVPELLLAAALQWITLTPYNTFFGAHVQNHGGDSVTIGLSITCAIAGEMLVMATSSRWLKRFQPRHVLAASAAVGVVRWTGTALGPPWLIICLQALHAFSFAAFYLSMIDAMVQRTPPHLRGSGQALLTAGGCGLGSLIGGLLAGNLFAVDEGRTLFLCVGAFSLLPALAALAIPATPPRVQL